jgi:hypothetical protein
MSLRSALMISVFAAASLVATAEQSKTVNQSPSSTQQQSVQFAQRSTCYTRCMGQHHDEPRCFKQCGNHDD